MPRKPSDLLRLIALARSGDADAARRFSLIYGAALRRIVRRQQRLDVSPDPSHDARAPASPQVEQRVRDALRRLLSNGRDDTLELGPETLARARRPTCSLT